jgi:hypothetical protein
MEFAKVAIRQRGGNTEVSSNMVQWIGEHHSFNNVTCKEYWIPTSPWVQGTDPESVQQRLIGELMRKDLMVSPLIPTVAFAQGLGQPGSYGVQPAVTNQQWAIRNSSDGAGRQCYTGAERFKTPTISQDASGACTEEVPGYKMNVIFTALSDSMTVCYSLSHALPRQSISSFQLFFLFVVIKLLGHL